MICPKTKAECDNAACVWDGCVDRPPEIPPSQMTGRALAAACSPTRGQAKLAEIERLVDALQQSTRIFGLYGTDGGFERMVSDRAALMAAIRLYVQE